MQLDTDEDGEPFFKPPTVASAPLRPSHEQPEDEEQHLAQASNASEPKDEGESEQPEGVTITTTKQQE